MPSDKFSLVFDILAVKDLKKIRKGDRHLAGKITSLIETLQFNPLQGKPLKGEKKGIDSLRYGDYRILYQIHFEEKLAHIIRIGNRKDIYR